VYEFVAANIGAVLGKIRVAKRLSGEFRDVLGTPYLPTAGQLELFAETISLIKGANLRAAHAALSELSLAQYWLEIASDPDAHQSARRVGREKGLRFLSSAEAALDQLATRLSH
jgi:hypothetical protein